MDGPGLRVVLFLQGCHLRCPWCHSPQAWEGWSPLLFNSGRCIACGQCAEVCRQAVHRWVDGQHQVDRENCLQCGRCVQVCPTSQEGRKSGALSLPTQEGEPEAIFELLRPQLEAVRSCGGFTLSGGEALLQTDQVGELLQICNDQEIHTAIETSLTLPTEVYRKVSPYVDCWLVGMRDLSFQGQGVDQDQLVLENVRYLASLDKEVIVRLPIIHGYTNTTDQLERLVRMMEVGKLREIELLPCNPDLAHYYTLLGLRPELAVGEVMPDEVDLEETLGFFQKAGFNARLIK